MRCYGATDERGMLGTGHQPMERPMPKPNDLSRSDPRSRSIFVNLAEATTWHLDEIYLKIDGRMVYSGWIPGVKLAM
jgi:hypothetical protein